MRTSTGEAGDLTIGPTLHAKIRSMGQDGPQSKNQKSASTGESDFKGQVRASSQNALAWREVTCEELPGKIFFEPERSWSALQSLLRHLPGPGITERQLETVMDSVAAAPDPDLCLRQLDHLLDRSETPEKLAGEILQAGWMPFLSSLLGSAPALAGWLVKHVDSTLKFLEDLSHPLHDPSRFARTRTEILEQQNRRQALLSLQHFRRRESYRIAASDLLGYHPLPTILSAISGLADFVVGVLLRLVEGELALPSHGFAVIGLGKLGAEELNFSSDIDLVYIASDDANLNALTRLARLLTRRLGEPSSEGRLYRVDLRLRPMGRTGEMVYPLGAYRQYFETHADTFDRLAMLKARFVAGDRELGAAFEKLVQPFVYRKYLDPAAIDEVRWLKKRSDARLSSQEKEENIKLGTGGIREVEFFLQSLQLLYGGQDPEIRSRGSLPTLGNMRRREYISEEDEARLREGYSFLRRVENFLQLESDLQVQSLPQQERSRRRLARLMDFDRFSVFEKALRYHGGRIHEIFLSLFESHQEGELRDLVLNPGLEPEAASKILSRAGINDREGIFLVNLRTLAEASAYPVSVSNMRNLLARVLPGLLEHASLTSDPASLLTRFDRLCERLGSRAHLYKSLVETPEFAHRLYRVLLMGDPLSRLLFRFPEVVDLISKPPDQEFPLRRLPPFEADSDPAEIAVKLRDYKEREELKLALQRIDGTPERRVRARLSDMAQAILGHVITFLLQQRPELHNSDITLLALGRLGGRELTFHSDLDLILMYDQEDPGLSPLFDDLVRDLKRLLEGQFSGPSTYQLDFRLRPEGRKSSPATPLGSFREYCQGRIQLWESLAYTRARPIFQQGRTLDFQQGVSQTGVDWTELEHVLHLRKRKQQAEPVTALFQFKLAPGGLFDLQLGLQLLCLKNGMMAGESRELLQELRARDLLQTEAFDLLSEALDFYQRLETALRLTTGKSVSCLPKTEPLELDFLAGLCGVSDGRALVEECRSLSRRVSRWFDSVCEQSRS